MEKSSLEVEAGVGRKLCFGTTEFKSSYDEIKGNARVSVSCVQSLFHVLTFIPAEPVSVFQLSALPGATLSAGPRDPINSPLDRESPDSSAFKRLPSNSLPSIGKTLRILQRSFPPSSSPYSSSLEYPNCVVRL
ncbi:hypothetical protein ALC60_04541 [Trachymyrmex zeteki]|uniref:Uncharacterized protein n=1 Tax=Mycetomoellerius zeteki TaxID=64791 RepID=A0A151X809_9HYME|nr:hypothetical protein ALC60_04541 [Trachymyrmex zeteki]